MNLKELRSLPRNLGSNDLYDLIAIFPSGKNLGDCFKHIAEMMIAGTNKDSGKMEIIAIYDFIILDFKTKYKDTIQQSMRLPSRASVIRSMNPKLVKFKIKENCTFLTLETVDLK